MVELNIGRLAPDVAALLWKAGAELPPLQWQSRANAATRKMLDEIDDRKLFARDVLLSEGMGAAVRSLLYLWNGWIGECSMYGQLAEPKERPYLAGLCERHLGHADAAKKFFQQLDGHPIFEDLIGCASEIVVVRAEPLLDRLLEMCSSMKTWEPFLFIDLHAQAVGGGLGSVGQELVRQLQRKEFELLFSYCYRGATGDEVLTRVNPALAVARKPVKKAVRPTSRRTAASCSSVPAERESPEREVEEPRRPSKAGAGSVNVQCPKCLLIASFPAAACGKTGQCTRCRSYFMIPRRGPAVASAGS